MIRIMLVDDHPIVQVGFKALLSTANDLEVVATATDGETAYHRYKEVAPDVAVLDLSMPGIGGFEALRRIVAFDPKARILILSSHLDAVHPARALEFGAMGYLSKGSAPDLLEHAIRVVFTRRRYLDPAVNLPSVEDGTPASLLSKREFEIFLMLAQGKSAIDVAAVLNLSAGTVGTHLYNIKQKLKATNHAELTLHALRWGLLNQEY